MNTSSYNPNETNESLFGENSIYDLAASPDLDGILLFSETIINEPLQQKILSILRRCSHIPVVAVGAELPDFSLPRFRFLNTDDVRDFEALTEHLIVEHGFRNIDLLTGHPQIQTSHQRAAGFRNAMQAHGLPVFRGTDSVRRFLVQCRKCTGGTISPETAKNAGGGDLRQ